MHKFYAGAQQLAPVQENVIVFQMKGIKSEEITCHSQVLTYTQRHGLPHGDWAHKGSCSKYGEAR